MHTHVAWLSFSRLISIMFCELPLTYFHRLPERKLLSGGVHEEFKTSTHPIDVVLTHLPLAPHICVSELGPHCFRWCPVACSAPSHYLNQCWFIANWTPGKKFKCDWNRNSFSFKKMHLKLSSAKMTTTLSGEMSLVALFGSFIHSLSQWSFILPAMVHSR